MGLHPSNEHENDQPIPHLEPGNEIDGEFHYFFLSITFFYPYKNILSLSHYCLKLYQWKREKSLMKNI